MYVSPEDLLKRNLIMESDLLALKKLKKSSKVEYSKVKAEKLKLLNIAYKNITEGMLETIKLLYKNHIFIYYSLNNEPTMFFKLLKSIVGLTFSF